MKYVSPNQTKAKSESQVACGANSPTSIVGLTRTAAMLARSKGADKVNTSIKRNMHITNQLGVRRWASPVSVQTTFLWGMHVARTS